MVIQGRRISLSLLCRSKCFFILWGEESPACWRVAVSILLSSAPALPCWEKVLSDSAAAAGSCVPGTGTAHCWCGAESSLSSHIEWLNSQEHSCCWRMANTSSQSIDTFRYLLQVICQVMLLKYSFQLFSECFFKAPHKPGRLVRYGIAATRCEYISQIQLCLKSAESAVLKVVSSKLVSLQILEGAEWWEENSVRKHLSSVSLTTFYVK